LAQLTPGSTQPTTFIAPAYAKQSGGFAERVRRMVTPQPFGHSANVWRFLFDVTRTRIVEHLRWSWCFPATLEAFE
jgi:hypothetical protein